MSHRSEPAKGSGSRVSPTAPASQSVSAIVWEHMERQPGFSKNIVEGERQIAAGQSTRLAELRRAR